MHEMIDGFETTLQLKKEGKVDEKVFNETRLRLGAYGQRYDNGLRHDGQKQNKIPFPTRATKGPNTEWDAPGMLRIKIPYGGLNTEQFLVLAEIAEEYSDDILHVTTRQDFQIHYAHIEDMPEIFRRLAAVGITTQEACGNSIRNITACPFAGVCTDNAFDVSPYAQAAYEFLLGHPDCQEFGRKFKISFSGCSDQPCGLGYMHDIGFVAKQGMKSSEDRGFHVLIGGGLGAIPVQAKTFYDFMPEENLLKFCQAVARVFARYGEKKNRNRARLKFLVNDWGIEKFTEEVEKEMKVMPHDDRWTDYLKDIPKYKELPKEIEEGEEITEKSDPEYDLWIQNNTQQQAQEGYVIATISLPLGDITSNQTRKLVELSRNFISDTIRTTVDQDLVFRWVREEDLPALYQGLKAINLADADNDSINNIVACPGTDTCKLGVSASRGLAGELRDQLKSKKLDLPESVNNLSIKASGCFNSCGQHHLADIGFYGVSRKAGDYMVPHFQLVLGGQRRENAAAYGLAMLAVPTKAVPETIATLTKYFYENKKKNETFQDYIKRLGKVEIKKLLQHLTKIPTYDEDPDFYTDWGDTRTYTKKDIGVGECAGEIVSGVEFALSTAEREVFEAQVSYDANKLEDAYEKALNSMLHAATGLVKEINQDVKPGYKSIQDEFKTHFVDTELFKDPFAGDKFAKYFLQATSLDTSQISKDRVHNFIEESQLFIEACHSYEARKNL